MKYENKRWYGEVSTACLAQYKQHEHSAMYSGRKEGGLKFIYFFVIVTNLNYIQLDCFI